MFETQGDGTMEIKQLQYFVVSVDMGSFQNAAKMLYTTQPHVSKTVKALEEELHLKLLAREARGVRMTEEGKKVYDYATQILKNTDMISRINEQTHLNRLAVATMPGSRITRLCAEFYGEQQDKRLQFSVKQGCLEEIMGFLHKHVIEFGFAYVSQHQMSALEQTLEVKRLEFVPIQTVRMSLMVGDKHPLFRADSVDDAELKTLRFVQYEEDYFSLLHHVGHLNESLHRYGKLENIVSTNSDTALMDLVVLGGLCHLGCMPLEQEYLDPKVKYIPIENTDDTIYFGYIKRKRDGISPICMELIEYVKEHL